MVENCSVVKEERLGWREERNEVHTSFPYIVIIVRLSCIVRTIWKCFIISRIETFHNFLMGNFFVGMVFNDWFIFID